jgi:murein L,D-transpeptidase YafK
MPCEIHSDAEPKGDEWRKEKGASAASPPAASSLPALSFASSQSQPPLKLPLVNPKIVVEKAARRLSLYSDGRVVRTYKIALGTNPVDDKIRQGDRATPEGDFYVCVKNARSNFYLSLGLSYPNLEDAERGLRDKLITRAQRDAIARAIKNRRRPPWDTALGGEIFIHGGGTDGDWTFGCVALANPDIKELFDAVPMGTSVRIER